MPHRNPVADRPERVHLRLRRRVAPAIVHHPVPPCYAPCRRCSLIDGSLYLVTSGRTSPVPGRRRRKPDRTLAVDVPTEACRTYRLPIGADQEFHPAFEMSGRLCLAVRTARRKLQFWVKSPSPPNQWVEGDDEDGELW
ncbi:hypothetical protein ZWY2020_018855 [Hordeum vulgare]|nr:hypothetical protein ZWY2020_018855 [Hordeum vulgare]